MELSLPQLTDEERLAALAQVYLALGLPLKAALDAARADLANLVAVQADVPPSTPKSRFLRLYLSHNRRALLVRIAWKQIEPHFQQDAIAGLHFLGDGNKLIESLPPTIVESHFLVFLAILFVLMDEERQRETEQGNGVRGAME